MTEQQSTAPEQLSLMHPSDLPLQFRIDARTRRLGLEQIARIRAQMANRQSGGAVAADRAA
jgi:hypothetical protein